MSSSFLRLISTDPSFVPDTISLASAKTFLSRRYTNDQVEFIFSENIEFIDQGQNFESVSCNLCGHMLDIEDWQKAMDDAYESKFVNLMFTTPCCKKNTSLNDLTYERPAGFAKHVISISSPRQVLTKDDLDTLQSVLKTKLRIIWSHY
jgi:hypothetical protein